MQGRVRTLFHTVLYRGPEHRGVCHLQGSWNQSHTDTEGLSSSLDGLKSYMQISSCVCWGVGAPNPCVVQGSTVPSPHIVPRL